MTGRKKYPETPDGRYFVVRGRLWRTTNPSLDEESRHFLIKDLMAARRAVRENKNDVRLLRQARQAVDQAKVALGEGGAPWWTDGAPDYNRRMAKSSPYAEWFLSLSPTK
ncbi:hypothetical protein [Pararhizobium arenae]|uniref:hypothetical protein n=1 Tax=Pararhizobium arenae TaxID=1856850 RepID=UPI00094B5297|nr:hypothetical protein [Pararhizobium arenae]